MMTGIISNQNHHKISCSKCNKEVLAEIDISYETQTRKPQAYFVKYDCLGCKHKSAREWHPLLFEAAHGEIKHG